MPKKLYAPLPKGNAELGEDTYTKAHMLAFADDTHALRLKKRPTLTEAQIGELWRDPAHFGNPLAFAAALLRAHGAA